MNKILTALCAVVISCAHAHADTNHSDVHDFNAGLTSTTITTTGDITTDGNLDLNVTGKTIILEDGTAASTCVGTATANGTTAVTVSTTCVQTGDYVFISANGADVNTANCWATNIVDATSFDLDCDAASTTGFNWIIIKGQ